MRRQLAKMMASTFTRSVSESKKAKSAVGLLGRPLHRLALR